MIELGKLAFLLRRGPTPSELVVVPLEVDDACPGREIIKNLASPLSKSENKMMEDRQDAETHRGTPSQGTQID